MDGAGGDSDEALSQQVEEYGKRGILVFAAAGEECTDPYFANLDEDEFRSNRFMYVCKDPEVVFGSKCDIQLPSLAVVKNHATIKFDGTTITLVAGRGATYHNGKAISEGAEVVLKVFDHVAMGDQLMILRWKGHEDE